MVKQNERRAAGGFTLIELLVVVTIIAILAALLLPALAGTKAKGRALWCLNSERQLALASQMYADDSGDRLPYNLGEQDIKSTVNQSNFLNWCSSIMNWELDADNTNTVLLTEGGIGPYVSRASRVYRCPSDWYVSDIQAGAGWSARVRSISMNAMVGNAGRFSQSGANVNNPGYQQFFKLSHVPQPSQIFVFIEEHPNSVNDGYFLNHVDSATWFDLPASYHNGAANLSFADGHSEMHKWLLASTKPPPRPGGAHLPIVLPPAGQGDFDWLMDRTTVDAGD